MKAVIVDLLDGQAAALCEDGRVVKLPDASYSLGQKIEVHARGRARKKWLRAVSSAAAAAVLVLGIGGTAWAMPYGVVTLDVNPSLEYTINCFDYVLAVDGVNEDGRTLLAGMDQKQLVHRRIGDALNASVAQLEAGEWLQEGGQVLLAAGARRDGHAERLLDDLRTGLSRGDHALEVRAFTVSRAEIEEAHETGVSAGRRHVLGALGDEQGADPADWAERPVAELLQELDGGCPQRMDENGAPAFQPQERINSPQQSEADPAPQSEPGKDAAQGGPDGEEAQDRRDFPSPDDKTDLPREEQTATKTDEPPRMENPDSAPGQTDGGSRSPEQGQHPEGAGPGRREVRPGM